MAKNGNKSAFVKRDAIVSGKAYARLLGSLKEQAKSSPAW
jgi:hypothetical protein